MTHIIDKFIEGSLTGNQIVFSTHYEKRLIERDLDRSYVKNLILNEDYLDFYEDMDSKGKFKAHYPSENNNFEIIIVIATQSDKIIIMTVYEKKIRRC